MSFTIVDGYSVKDDVKIHIMIPEDLDISKLKPTILISKNAVVNPSSGVIKDFSTPVIYTVTAQDGSSKQYTITVSKEIGPAGGYVFHDKGFVSDGWRFLEAAQADYDEKLSWSNGVAYIETGATRTAVGTGQENTLSILEAQGSGTYGAFICYELVAGSKSDWFLPSKDELNEMYKNLRLNDLGGFVDYYYWSSSQVPASGGAVAYYQSFSHGGQNIWETNTKYNIRCARAF